MIEVENEDLQKSKRPVLVAESELADKDYEIYQLRQALDKLRQALEKAEKEKINLKLNFAEKEREYQKLERRSNKQVYEKSIEDLKQNMAVRTDEPCPKISKLEN